MERQRLRSGFTTGTCAAAAAKAAAVMLFTGKEITHMNMITPKGTEADMALFHIVQSPGCVSCAVKKDGGDDPDVTNGVFIYASVSYLGHVKPGAEEEKRWYIWKDSPNGKGTLYLEGGEGVGLVTKQGLMCPVGKSAINPVPRQMIFGGVDEIKVQAGYEGDMLIRVWIPDGVGLARQTFNPKLGIEGGISILGTSGVVEPMSEAALIATIRLELHMKAVAGKKKIVLTPGNYGETFLKETLKLSLEQGVKCSNFLGEAVELTGKEGFEEILLVGHIGKLIKVAAGVKNTHSKYGDRRMEILWDCTKTHAVSLSEKDQKHLEKQILGSNTTEEAIGFLKESNLCDAVMQEVTNRIQTHVKGWLDRGIRAEVVTFSLRYGILGSSSGADEMIGELSGQEQNR